MVDTGGDGPVLEAVARALMEHDRDAYVVMRAVRDPSGRVVDFVHLVVNQVAEQNAGRPLAGRRLLEAYDRSDATLFDVFREVVESQGQVRQDLSVPATAVDPGIEGRSYEVYAKGVDGDLVVCQYRDVSEVKAAESALREEALHDSLTGLLNRRAFLEHLGHALDKLVRHEGLVAVLFCDLDGFKHVNDTYGHHAGDVLLCEVAAGIRSALRPQDVVARFGGDEFVVLCEDLARADETVDISHRVREAVRSVSTQSPGRPAALSRAIPPAGVDISIGVSVTHTQISPEQILAEADTALYEAKSTAQGVVVFGAHG